MVKAEVVADAAVDAGAEMRLGSRATFALIVVPAGTTTIQPWLRVNGATGKRGSYLHRRLTLESATS
ncbi:hypothetical protein [Paractinoplanes brasiliensis]|uniref:Uncharacterized protein n=1 Tax=Paractinoplanes brasiliensis TaxID=52695 RepID=A0A4R6JZS5_9ACTN|nr:hypothetical protein [Actinoplanes brasiliensis]TDO42423.1 hypothetical protein C8E87_6195 [Actinoplanes brasiliensis]